MTEQLTIDDLIRENNKLSELITQEETPGRFEISDQVAKVLELLDDQLCIVGGWQFNCNKTEFLFVIYPCEEHYFMQEDFQFTAPSFAEAIVGAVIIYIEAYQYAEEAEGREAEEDGP